VVSVRVNAPFTRVNVAPIWVRAAFIRIRAAPTRIKMVFIRQFVSKNWTQTRFNPSKTAKFDEKAGIMHFSNLGFVFIRR
jgi:hypothetical protein